jgi:H+-transporting ATPase
MQTPDATGAAAPTIAETLSKLGADSKVGLTDAEVQARLKKYGPNALVEKQKNTFAALLAYFWGPIPWMIEAAALMAFIVGDWGDFTIITSLLLFNAVLGFWEEHEASNALDALKGSLALKARALRNGTWQQIDARTLVPGDIVRLYLGDVVPADCTLTAGDYISIDQSALTGESLPVSKKSGSSFRHARPLRSGCPLKVGRNCSDSSRSIGACSHAGGALGDHGPGRANARKAQGNRLAIGSDRGTGRRGCALFR